MDILISNTELWFDIKMKAMQFVVMDTPHIYTTNKCWKLSKLNTIMI